MAVEAFSVGFEKTNFHAPIDPTLDRESVLIARGEEIIDNLSSYIGEYRLGVKFDEYFYNIGQDHETGEKFLRSKELKPVLNIYRNAILERERNNLSTKREVAECLGFEKLEKELLEREVGTMAIWVSPPGPKSDGYGNYSFTFIGQVEEKEEGKRIRMIPYRNELSIEEHNKYLSKITGQEINFSSDLEFLYNPFVFEKREQLENPEDILREIGEREEFDNSWRKNFVNENWFLFQHFLYQVRNDYPDYELAKTRNAIEFLAIEYRDRKNRGHTVLNEGKEYVIPQYSAQDYIARWDGIEPPKVSGSCGASGGSENDLVPSTPMEFQNSFGKIIGEEEDEYGSLTFNCPEKSCGRKNTRPRGKLLDKCQHCRSTKVAC